MRLLALSLCSCEDSNFYPNTTNFFLEVHLDVRAIARPGVLSKGRLVVALIESALGAHSLFQAMAGGSSPGKTRPGFRNKKLEDKTMKAIGKFIGGLVLVGMLTCLATGFAQTTASLGSFNNNLAPVQTAPPDTVVQIAAESQGLAQIAPADLPFGGTYFWAQPDGGIFPMPFLPQDAGPIYQITDNQFLVDNSSGELAVPARPRRFGMQAQSSSTIASMLAAQADALVGFINQSRRAVQPRICSRLWPRRADG